VLAAGLSSLQWTVNAYNIALAAGIISGAALGDRFGRRRTLVGGLLAFTAASALCALAPTASLLVAARVLQGAGGAIVLPLSLTILAEAYPAERRAAILGVYGGIAGIAVAAGPLVGGALTEGLDWHWIFWLNVPIGVLAAGLSARLLPESRGPAVGLDLGGVALVSLACVGLVWGLVRGPDAGWESVEVLGALAFGVLAFAAFAVWEQHAAAPLLPPRLLRVPAFMAANASGFLLNASIVSGAFLTTQWFQLGLGWSPVETGVRLLPFFATPLVIAPVAGALGDRIGLRLVIVAGLLLQAAGFAAVALGASGRGSYGMVVLALLIAGIGVSMTLPTVPAMALGAADPADMGTASGVNTMLQRLGQVFGVAVASAVFASRGSLASPAQVTAGYRPAVVVVSAFALLAAVAAVGVGARRGVVATPTPAAA
jgi:EmrB/QacA subfamily drug resistance transporter